jgi:pimeloyl-ACP methyl ester carboxylesterase
MTRLIKLLAAIAIGTVLATNAFAQSATSADRMEHHIAKIDGTRFHYVTAGTGDPVLLIPGWPESWIAWRKIVPLLVGAGRRVVVLDPRGFGESDKPAGGYDLDTAARDLHRFLATTNLAMPGGIDIVAHDVGTWIAHAHAVTYPADARRLVLTESNIPGVTSFASPGIPSEAVNLKSWQFAFNRLDDLPEILVQGREREYLAWIFATKSFRSYAIEGAALEEYTAVFGTRRDARRLRLVPGEFRCGGPGAGEGARCQAIDHAGLGARRIRRGGRRAARNRRHHRRPCGGRRNRRRDHRLWSLSAGGMPG